MNHPTPLPAGIPGWYKGTDVTVLEVPFDSVRPGDQIVWAMRHTAWLRTFTRVSPEAAGRLAVDATDMVTRVDDAGNLHFACGTYISPGEHSPEILILGGPRG